MLLFGEWLRQHRRRLGLSQEGLARRAGVERTYITRLESGIIRMPQEDTRAKLHEVLGTSEEQLWQQVDRSGLIARPGDSLLHRLDQALRDLTDGDRQMVERLVEDVIRVARAMATKPGGG